MMVNYKSEISTFLSLILLTSDSPLSLQQLAPFYREAELFFPFKVCPHFDTSLAISRVVEKSRFSAFVNLDILSGLLSSYLIID